MKEQEKINQDGHHAQVRRAEPHFTDADAAGHRAQSVYNKRMATQRARIEFLSRNPHTNS